MKVRLGMWKSHYHGKYGTVRVYEHYYISLPMDLVRDELGWHKGDTLDAYVMVLPNGKKALFLCKGCMC